MPQQMALQGNYGRPFHQRITKPTTASDPMKATSKLNMLHKLHTDKNRKYMAMLLRLHLSDSQESMCKVSLAVLFTNHLGDGVAVDSSSDSHSTLFRMAIYHGWPCADVSCPYIFHSSCFGVACCVGSTLATALGIWTIRCAICVS